MDLVHVICFVVGACLGLLAGALAWRWRRRARFDGRSSSTASPAHESARSEMLVVLGAAKALVESSTASEWTGGTLEESSQILGGMVRRLLEGGSGAEYAAEVAVQFAPTGPLQEIALANGWHDIYLVLASDFDRLQAALIAMTGRMKREFENPFRRGGLTSSP